jgi:hypothetical protein
MLLLGLEHVLEYGYTFDRDEVCDDRRLCVLLDSHSNCAYAYFSTVHTS